MERDIKPKESLTKERIVTTAMEIVDRDGLDALTMRGLAAEMNTAPMSLYNHVPNKAALLDAMVDRLLSALEPPDERAAPSQRLRDIAAAMRTGARDHPEVFRIIAVQSPTSSRLTAALDRELGNLRRLGWDPIAAADAVRICFAYMFGYIRLETGGFFPALEESAKENLNRPIDGEAVSTIANHPRELARWDPDVEFERGLEALLEGLKETSG